MSNVIVVIGPGSIGQAIARRVSAGKHVLLADLRQENADAAAEMLSNAGFEVSTATVDVSSRESVHALVQTATALGDVTGLIHAAGVSPSQASPTTILSVDLYGTALVLEEFGNVIARGGAGVVIASQSGHRLGRADGRTGRRARDDARRRVARPADASAGPGDGLPARVPTVQARKRAAGDGRGRAVGQAWCAGKHDQSRHHLHPAGEGRTDRPARRGLPAHDRALPGRARRHAGRGRNRRGAPDGTGRRVHHRQPIPEVGLWAMVRLVVSNSGHPPVPDIRRSFGGSDASRVDTSVRGDVVDLAARNADIH